MTNTIKFKYDKKDNNILYLKEYLFCTDEENQDLFIIFKFRNAYKQVLYAFEAEVTQYDEENNVLETSIFTYNNCEIRKKSDFVPYKKLHAYADCKSISVKIIYAKYSNKTFNEEYLNFDDWSWDDANKRLVSPDGEHWIKIVKGSKSKGYMGMTVEYE